MISGLGSAMTACAPVIWAHTQSDLALQTALLTVCSYAPHVIRSVFAGVLSDRWNKKPFAAFYPATASGPVLPTKEITSALGRHTISRPPAQKPRSMQ